MGGVKRLFAIILVFCGASFGWTALGGITSDRGRDQSSKLRGSVQSLWGSAQTQPAPSFVFHWTTTHVTTHEEIEDERVKLVKQEQVQQHSATATPSASNLRVDLASDLRRKGLMWYSLYDVAFDASYDYVHEDERVGELEVGFVLPDPNGIYDDFRVLVDGKDYAGELEDGVVTARVPVEPGQRVRVQAGYASRGLDEWRYRLAPGMGRVRNFALHMTTDYHDIDFPYQTLSPSSRERTADGWKLDWEFEQLVSGYGIGMVMPHRIQPGELASQLSFSAPVSLLFFFLVLYVLATLRRIDIHPINYLMLAGAFFAFHLLFAYSVDHLTIEAAFTLCSVVSIVLVVSYLRLVVSNKFAFREAALAQLVYLIGFSLAHFWEGFTGLTVTVLAILTLFLLMQLTGRVKWSQVFDSPPPKRGKESPARDLQPQG